MPEFGVQNAGSPDVLGGGLMARRRHFSRRRKSNFWLFGNATGGQGASHFLCSGGNTTILQSRKSAQCLFSIQQLMASGELVPAFGQRRPTLLNQKNGMHPADIQHSGSGMLGL